MRSIALVLYVCLSLMVLACSPMPSPSPSPDIDTIVAQTMTAYVAEQKATQVVQTLEVLQTQVVAGGATLQLASPAVSSSVLPSPAPTALLPSPTPEEIAPNPLPPVYSGITLYNGECFDLDSGQIFTSANAQCDVRLVEPALIRQQKGARLSGYVTRTPPTRSACLGARYEPGDLAMQTGLYYCFITNAGQPGFLVPTGYLGGIPPTAVVFDYWVFY